MKKSFLYSICILTGFLLFQANSYALTVISEAKMQAILWQCEARDSAGQSFLGDQIFNRKNAKDSALKACENYTKVPGTCVIQKCLGESECHGNHCD